MKGLWYVVVLLVIRFTMDLILRESLPLWASYDTVQRMMVVGLLAVFTIVGVCVAILGFVDMHATRTKGYRIGAF